VQDLEVEKNILSMFQRIVRAGNTRSVRTLRPFFLRLTLRIYEHSSVFNIGFSITMSSIDVLTGMPTPQPDNQVYATFGLAYCPGQERDPIHGSA